MRSSERLQRILALRHSGVEKNAAAACAALDAGSTLAADLRLFALTFACGFLFTTIFIA